MAANISDLSMVSQTLLPSGSLVQGGDIFNFTFNLTYNGPTGSFTHNSPLCNGLNTSSTILQGFITLPLVLNIVSSAIESQVVTSDVSSCITHSLFNISVTSDLTNSSSFIRINASNVAWTVKLQFVVKVTERVQPDSRLNITGNFTVGDESKLTLITHYTAYPITDLSVLPLTTSLGETPALNLTTDEEVEIKAKIKIPSVTADMRLLVTLPAFKGLTPMGFVYAYVSVIPIGISSNNLRVGSSGQFSVGSTYAISFPAINNVASFNFGKTVNTIPLANSSEIEVVIKARVMSSLGTFAPNSEENVTVELIYQTPSGPKSVGPHILTLGLSEPLLEFAFNLVNPQPFYEGRDEVILYYKVSNPSFATAAAMNVSVDIMIPLDLVDVKNTSVQVCESFKCAALNSSGVNATINSLNISSELHGSITILLKPTVIAGSSLLNNLYLSYLRQDWNPVNKDVGLTIAIKKIQYTGPHSLTSSVSSPNDQSVITPDEEITFELKMILPISSSRHFMVLIKASSIEVVGSSVKSVGGNIVSAGGEKLQPGLQLNITSAPVPGITITHPSAIGQFGTVANTGSSSVPDDNCVLFRATIQAGNASTLTGINYVTISLQAFLENDPSPQQHTFQLQVVRPELTITGSASPYKQVKANQYVDFTFSLAHTSLSKAHAYRVVLEIAVPHQYLVLDESSVSPTGSVRVVNGDQTVSGSARYNSPQTKVLIYKSNEFRLNAGSPTKLVIRYRARTAASIPSSVYINTPTYLSYTILPASLAPRTGWVYKVENDKAAFLTIRPEPYVQVLNTPDLTILDAGDRIEYKITVSNTGSQGKTYTAYDFKITVSFGRLDMARTTMTCDRGSPIITGSTANLVIGNLLDKETFVCTITGFVQDDVIPKENISPLINYRYYSRDSGSRPAGVASYAYTSRANVHIATVEASINGSSNVNNLLAGDQFSFSIRLSVPECVTTLKVRITMPIVDRNGTRFARQRRSMLEVGDEEELRRSSRVRRNANLVYVLIPLLNESSATAATNSTMIITHPSPNITSIDSTTLEVDFGSVQHKAHIGRATQDLLVELKFRIVNLPLILSGRTLPLTMNLLFNGSSDSAVGMFTIVGPLVKPLLTITKSVKAVDTNRDSPLLLYNVTVTHAPGSSYDAYDVEVRDIAQGMELQRASVQPTRGVMVTFPAIHTYHVTLSIPKLAVGDTTMLHYTASFIIKDKSQRSVNLPGTVFWKSIQLNSPRYQLDSNLSACVTRVDSSKFTTRQVTGYFALGTLLGLLIGLIVAMVIIFLIIKCCDKGRVAPCYTRFTNQKSMTVLTGGSQYIFNGGGSGDGPENKLVARHNETSIVQTDESIIPILTLDSSTQTEKELDSLDVQATVAQDADLEIERQNMFLQAMSLLAKRLRVKREISSSEEENFLSNLKSEVAGIAHKLAAEFKRRSAEIRRRLQKQFKVEHAEIIKRQAKEIKETETKIRGHVNPRERREIIDMLRKRHAKEEQDLRKKCKLDEDVEMEKLRKEIAVNKRFAMKESQSKLLQELIKEAKLNEEQASALVREHLGNMAAIDKAMDEEKSRRVVALEMRLAERRAIARQKHDESDFNNNLLHSMEEHHEEAMDELVRSSKLSEAEAAAYLERYKKDVEALNKKLDKDKQKQENTLHKRLTALKQKRLEDKNREHQQQLRELDEEQNDKYEQVAIDCVAAVEEKHKLLQRQRQERGEIEKEADKEAATELEKVDEAHAREVQEHAKTSLKKIYNDMASKGLAEAEKNAIFDRHMEDLSRQQEAREEERQHNAETLQKRLSKLRKNLENKAIEENEEHAVLRRKEEQIVNDLIVNQVVMSEEERDRIIEEHEKNLAELETSLTFNKLRQRQKLEEKLTERRKRRMAELERRQQGEEQDRDSKDTILAEGENVELLMKHEQEKIEMLKGDSDSRFEDEMEQVREDMINERTKQLEDHQENLSATIAKLQIEKAKQMSQMAMQQQLLGQLQTTLVDELEEQGAFDDPETQRIVEKYKKDAKKLEQTLNNQKQKQEEALRGRLQKKMKEREEKLLMDQKDAFSQYMEDGVSKTTMRFRKAAVKARQQKEMEDLKERFEREIEQSLNELKLAQEIQRMKAIEDQNLKFISGLIAKGHLKEEEIESVLKFLFPTKSSEYIDELMVKIYGPAHVKSSTSLVQGDVGNFEQRVRRASVKPTAFVSNKKSGKKKKRDRRRDEDDESTLPPVVIHGGKRPSRQHDSLPPLDDGLRRSLRGHRESMDMENPESNANSLPFPRHSSQSFSPGGESPEDQRLLDEMFGESSEGDELRRSGKKKKKRKK